MAQERSVVTPGNHDGVHLGHRALLAAARARAGHDRVVALTFDPHPAVLLAPDRAPPLLTTIARRTELFAALGADVHVARFDREFAAQTADEFVANVLVRDLAARRIVVGPDFHFGRGRAGDPELLRLLGERHGFEVDIVPPVVAEGDVVSSTRIRAALIAGDVALAARLLARPHDVDGTVVRGDQRGRSIGVPTANLDLNDPVLLPADGVYAIVGRELGRDETLRGVANLGVRPTFAAGRSVEAHFFDFDRDLYDRRVRVAFVARLRSERKFDGIGALKAQIAKDVEDARAALEELPAWT